MNKLYNNYILLYDTEKLLFNSIDQEKNILKKSKISRTANNSNIIIDEKGKIGYDKFDKENKEYKKRGKIEESRIYNGHLNNTAKINNNNSNTHLKLDNSINKSNKNYIYKDEKKNESNFFLYIRYKILCNNADNNFHIFNNFRIRILSEDHLIRNHLNIYNF